MSNEKKEYKQDSVLVGWTDEPVFKDNGDLKEWKIKLKKDEVEQMLNNYVTDVFEKDGKQMGGNVLMTLFMSNAGNACCRVFDPNSEGAKESKARKEEARKASQSKETEVDSLPF